MIDANAIPDTRYWQNWDQGDAAQRIDDYWLSHEGEWRRVLAADIEAAFSGAAKPIDMLEVGCGTGLIFQALEQQGLVDAGSYRGGDASGQMLAIARQRKPEVSFERLDIFGLPMGDAFAPNVINIHVLQHLPHYEQAVTELVRISRDRLYIASWFEPTTQDHVELSPPSAEFAGQRFHNNRYALQAFSDWLLGRFGARLREVRHHHFGGPIHSFCLYFKQDAGT